MSDRLHRARRPTVRPAPRDRHRPGRAGRRRNGAAPRPDPGRGGGPRGDELLVATGRIPNSDQLAVERTGVRTDAAGRVIVHDDLQTDVAGIWAFGDLANHYQLKHVANAEARVVFHNLAHPDDPWLMDYSIVPHAVFGNPQVASVGLTEEEAAADGVPFVCATKEYGSTAYGWAMEDTTSFVKLIAHAKTQPPAGCPHPRSAGVDPHPDADPGDAIRPDRRRDGPRADVDPSRVDRGAGERPARRGRPTRPLSGRLSMPCRPPSAR